MIFVGQHPVHFILWKRQRTIFIEDSSMKTLQLKRDRPAMARLERSHVNRSWSNTRRALGKVLVFPFRIDCHHNSPASDRLKKEVKARRDGFDFNWNSDSLGLHFLIHSYDALFETLTELLNQPSSCVNYFNWLSMMVTCSGDSKKVITNCQLVYICWINIVDC